MNIRFCVKTLLFLLMIAPAATPSAAEITLWDVTEQVEISLEQFVDELSSPGIVYVGESHDNEAHHAAQLEVIRSLNQHQRPLAVGLEMFQHIEQSILDAWVARQLSEDEMRRAFARNWSGEWWYLYRDIFIYCRDQNIPMVGLNVPRSITRKVSRSGFGSLSTEEVGKLPFIECRVDPEYEDFLRRVLGSHGSDSGFRRFCEAQLVWDTAFAIYALEYMADHPEQTMVVLCGMVHAWKKAAPEQALRNKADIVQTVIQPSVAGRWMPETISKEDADYLILGLDK